MGLGGSSEDDVRYQWRSSAMIEKSAEMDARAGKKGKRQTQAERSSNTQAKICNATLEALAEVGYHCITTAFIAKKAKVSRGALTHQYASRNDLLVAALQRLHNDWSQVRPFTANPTTEEYTVAQLITELWENLFSDKRYIASLELMVAARLDNDLGIRLRDEMSRWVNVRDEFLRSLNFTDRKMGLNVQHLHLMMSTMRGVALYQLFDRDVQAGQKLIELYSSLVESRVDPADTKEE